MHAANSRAMGLFANQARGVEMRGVGYSPGFNRGCIGCAPRSGLAGLGDWFSDAVDSLHKGGVSVIGAITGSTAAAEAQRNAVAIAQAQAAADMESSKQLGEAVPWIAGAIGLAAVAAIMLSRKG